MAVGQFSINFSDMQATVEAAEAQARQVTDILDALNQAEQKTLSEWVGQAAEDFQATVAYCLQQAQQLPTALSAAAQTLSAINTGTSNTEVANAKRFSV